MSGRFYLRALSVMACVGLPAISAWAARPRHASGLNWAAPSGAGGSVPWNIVALLTLLTVLPALLVAMTPFARMLVVFHFLRQALGTQTAPSNQTLIGLALVLTYFLMQPVGSAMYNSAIVPFQRGQIDAWAAIEKGSPPLRTSCSNSRARKILLCSWIWRRRRAPRSLTMCQCGWWCRHTSCRS